MKVSKFVYWTPRILSIVFVLWLMLFSLDVFEPGLSAWQIAIGLFMHNIPALILLAVTIYAWKNEIVGAIGFFAAGILYMILLLVTGFTEKFEWYMISWSLFIAGPAFLTGILFWINWKKKKR